MIHYSPFTIHRSLFTVHRSPFTKKETAQSFTSAPPQLKLTLIKPY